MNKTHNPVRREVRTVPAKIFNMAARRDAVIFPTDKLLNDKQADTMPSRRRAVEKITSPRVAPRNPADERQTFIFT
ncbi:hypothetical protein XENTR_v10019567 [Xenopus tropicalis]|nr:hypothetical protein XENTR_v10019567 [Xenopus tropicalis]